MRTATGLRVDPSYRAARNNRWGNKSAAERFWAKVDMSGECWLWTGSKNAKGYGTTAFASRSILAHRMAWSMAHGEIPAGALVLHSATCISRACVRPDHLRLGDQKENVADTLAAGCHHCQQGPPAWIGHPEMCVRGEDSGSARLKAKEVLAIRAAYAAGGRTITSIAREFGIGLSQASRIIHGESWKHLLQRSP